MKILLIIMFVILVPLAIFLLWVFAKIAGVSTNMEEQMEIERKLRNDGQRKSNGK